MTRGFVTIATGDLRYHKIAYNLLLSYRAFAKEPLPFAIISDRESRYTRHFDDMIIMRDAECSYTDKIKLPRYIPYDETIFIDSDCLAYTDLNAFWDAFPKDVPFSAFGKSLPLDCEWGWFRPENVGRYRELVRYIPDFVGGVYFLRKGDELNSFADIAEAIRDTYGDYTFRQFDKPSDETVFALAMAVNDYRTVPERAGEVCAYFHKIYCDADIGTGRLRYASRYDPEGFVHKRGSMIHWGSGNTYRSVYLTEVYKLRRKLRGKNTGEVRAAVFRKAAPVYTYWMFAGKKLRRKINKLKNRKKK